MYEIERWLAEAPTDPPYGPGLEYHPDFLSLEQAGQEKPEQQFGDAVVPAEEPDWGDVRLRAESLLERTKDLRVATWLVRAWTRTDHLPGLVAGLQMLHGLVERYWDGLYPPLDRDDGDDPTMRVNAIAPLTRNEALPRDVRAALVVPVGAESRVTVRDILVANGRLPGSGAEPGPSGAQIAGILQGVAAGNAANTRAASAALDAATALQALLNERIGSEQAPDLAPLAAILQDVAAALQAAAPDPVEEGPTGRPREGAPAPDLAGEIRSREQAVRVLETVCIYLERSEPANPAPLLIRRAQRLMTKSFVEIIEDLAPESMGTIENLAGIKRG